jgi:hypothetical protein
MIFTSKAELKNFKTAFTPPKTFSFTRNVLHALKVKAAQLIGKILKLTTESEGAKYLATKLDFTSANIKCLPLGYHTNKPPVQSYNCDMPACCLKDSNWKLFTGCFHSFHMECLKGIDSCPICCAHLRTVINKLSSTAQQSIFSPNDKNEKDAQKEQDASNKAPRIPEEAKECLDAKVKKINDDILAIEVPDLQSSQQPDAQQFTNLQL